MDLMQMNLQLQLMEFSGKATLNCTAGGVIFAYIVLYCKSFCLSAVLDPATISEAAPMLQEASLSNLALSKSMHLGSSNRGSCLHYEQCLQDDRVEK